jgi:hypothetical protein
VSIRVEKVDKSVAFPPPRRRWNERRRLPFPDLLVGESFFVPLPALGEARRREYDRTKTLAQYYQSTRKGRKFSIRAQDDGIRVWRVK